MDFSSFISILVIVAFFTLVILWKRSKGKRGEKRMAYLLSRLPDNEYKVINDLLLQSNGYSTQIDHVVVSVYGIFVIETKNRKGWISGGENTEMWTQTLYRHKYQLRNPVWQNNGHITAIKRELSDPGRLTFYNIVAFSRQARLRRVNKALPVMHLRQVVPYIKRFTEPVISEQLVKDIYSRLLSANITDKAARRAHVKQAKQSRRRRDIAVSNGKCPLCGSDLVQRKGQYGRFYGCSNYPRCKYILK